MRKTTYSMHQRRWFLARHLVLLFALHTGAAQALWWPFGEPTWPDTKRLVRKSFPKAPALTVPQLQAWLADNTRAQPLLLDVRSATEFADGHLAKAQHADGSDAAAALLLPLGLDLPVVVYCSVGYRSGKVVEALIQRGHKQVWNLEGSLFEWANSGLPMVQGGPKAELPTQKAHPFDKTWAVLLKRELWSRPP
jgi:rhodanese-related sulfurtransferase